MIRQTVTVGELKDLLAIKCSEIEVDVLQKVRIQGLVLGDLIGQFSNKTFEVQLRRQLQVQNIQTVCSSIHTYTTSTSSQHSQNKMRLVVENGRQFYSSFYIWLPYNQIPLPRNGEMPFELKEGYADIDHGIGAFHEKLKF